MISLDVGCGNNPKGDVNVDLYLGRTEHRWKRLPIDKRQILNLVNSDGQFLPFRDNSFEVSYSAHTIEHLKDFDLMIKELERVAEKTIIIIIPFGFYHNFFTFWSSHAHEHVFWSNTFKERGYKTRVRARLIRPNLVRNKRFPLPIYPMFEIVARKKKYV